MALEPTIIAEVLGMLVPEPLVPYAGLGIMVWFVGKVAGTVFEIAKTGIGNEQKAK